MPAQRQQTDEHRGGSQGRYLPPGMAKAKQFYLYSSAILRQEALQSARQG